MREPRGKRVRTNRPVMAGAVEFTGLKPLIVAYCRTGTGRARADLAFWAHKLGLSLGDAPAHDVGHDGRPGWLTAYAVTGTPQALEVFTGLAVCERWHFPLAVSVPYAGPRE